MNIFIEVWEWPYRILLIYSFALLAWCIVRPLDATVENKSRLGQKSVNMVRKLIRGLIWLSSIFVQTDRLAVRCWAGIARSCTNVAKSTACFDRALAVGWRIPAAFCQIIRLAYGHKEEPNERSASL